MVNKRYNSGIKKVYVSVLIARSRYQERILQINISVQLLLYNLDLLPTDIQSVNRIHGRALRIAYNDYTSDFEKLLCKDDSVIIHQRNIHVIAVKVYKTLNPPNPVMKEIFFQKNTYSTRRQQLITDTPCTVTYTLSPLGIKQVKF